MSWENEYQKTILSARNNLLNRDGYPKALISQFVELYSQVLGQIENDMRTGRITEARAQSLSRSINNLLDRLTDDIAEAVQNGTIQAANVAVDAHRTALANLAESFPTSTALAVTFDGIPEAALQAMAVRRGLPEYNYRSLLGRRLGPTKKAINDYLTQAVARGLSARNASEELVALLIGDNPNFADFIDRTGNVRLSRSKLQKLIKQVNKGEIDLFINTDTIKEVRSLLVDATRIVRTEIPTAYREANLLASIESPVVKLLKWEVSGRHYGLPSSPDVCTIFHESDQFGFGAGVFPIRSLPSTPHPNCGCYQSEIFRGPNEWDDPKIKSPKPKMLRATKFSKMFDSKTETYLDRQIELANTMNKLAFEASK